MNSTPVPWQLLLATCVAVATYHYVFMSGFTCELSTTGENSGHTILDDETWQALKQAVWRDNLVEDDVARWLDQGFVLDGAAAGTPFGLIQRSGGPCGVLAAVQAYMICRLLFSDDLTRVRETLGDDATDVTVQTAVDAHQKLMEPRQDTLLAALSHALAFAIWQARPSSDAMAVVLVLNTGSNPVPADVQMSTTSESSGSTVDPAVSFTLLSAASCFCVHNFSIFGELEAFLRTPSLQSQLASRSGVAQLLLSVILTRTLTGLAADMDEPSPLVARFGHCTQELLNLLLTGRARSNAFDGEQDLGGGLLVRGIDARPIVGYLSALEALRYLVVGSFYKRPLLPVWVVGSESHFSMLWGVDVRVNDEAPSAVLLRAFSAHDTHNAQMIATGSLGAVLAALRLPIASDASEVAALASRIEMEGTGMIGWGAFFAAVAPLYEESRKGATLTATTGAELLQPVALPATGPLIPVPTAGAMPLPPPQPLAADSGSTGIIPSDPPPRNAAVTTVSAAALLAAFDAVDAEKHGSCGFILLSSVSDVLARANLAPSVIASALPTLQRALNPDRDPNHDSVVVVWDDMRSAAQAARIVSSAPASSDLAQSLTTNATVVGSKRRVRADGTVEYVPAAGAAAAATSSSQPLTSNFPLIDLSKFGVGNAKGATHRGRVATKVIPGAATGTSAATIDLAPGVAAALVASAVAPAVGHADATRSSVDDAAMAMPLRDEQRQLPVGRQLRFEEFPQLEAARQSASPSSARAVDGSSAWESDNDRLDIVQYAAPTGTASGIPAVLQRTFELWHFNGLRGGTLSRLQLRQDDEGSHLSATGVDALAIAAAMHGGGGLQPANLSLDEAMGRAMALSVADSTAAVQPPVPHGAPHDLHASSALLGVLRTKWPGVSVTCDAAGTPSLD